MVLVPNVAFEVNPADVVQVMHPSGMPSVSLFARNRGTAEVLARGKPVARVTVTVR